MKPREKLGNNLKKLSLKKRRNLFEQILVLAHSNYKKLKNALITIDNQTLAKLYLRARSLERSIKGQRHTLVTVEELLVWTTEWIKSFSRRYDLVVGVPRSGLLVANIIALKLGKPLTTPELLSKNYYWEVEKGVKKGKKKHENILLVDDSITSGKTMKKSLKLLRLDNKNSKITKAVLIATKETKSLVDLHYKLISQPRIFEWNLLHAKKGKLVSDLDGVICENCPPGVDLNEKHYLRWLKEAKPYLIPTFEIDVILSSRLERYRIETERWLAKHGVRYKELILWNLQSKQERNGKHAQYKTKALLKIKPEMFWESSFGEAKQVWKATKIPTLCVNRMILFS